MQKDGDKSSLCDQKPLKHICMWNWFMIREKEKIFKITGELAIIYIYTFVNPIVYIFYQIFFYILCVCKKKYI